MKSETTFSISIVLENSEIHSLKRIVEKFLDDSYDDNDSVSLALQIKELLNK